MAAISSGHAGMLFSSATASCSCNRMRQTKNKSDTVRCPPDAWACRRHHQNRPSVQSLPVALVGQPLGECLRPNQTGPWEFSANQQGSRRPSLFLDRQHAGRIVGVEDKATDTNLMIRPCGLSRSKTITCFLPR
jgi:hypothetical protein